MEGSVEGTIESIGKRMWRRSRNILIVGFGAIAVLVGFMAWLVVNGATIALANEVYFFVFIPVLIGYGFYAQWSYTRKFVGFVKTLAPRLRDVVFQRRAGIIAVFDNGLLFRQLRVGNGPSGFLFATFLDENRAPVVPTKDQIVPWSKSFGRRQKVGAVSRRKGPQATRAQLDAIRESMGSSAAYSLLEHRATTSDDGPSYYVGVVLLDRKWLKKGNDVLRQVDAIDGFLKQMPLQDFSQPLAPR